MIYLRETLINIKTVQLDFASKKEDVIELVTEGVFYEEGDFSILSYDESEISGMKGTKTTLMIKEGFVSMKKNGSNTSLMEFEKGKRYKSSYKTPYGDMSMEILTKDVSISKAINPFNIEINIEYEIIVKGFFEGKNKMHIMVS